MEVVADKEVRVDRLVVVRVRPEMVAMEAEVAALAQVEEIQDSVGQEVAPVTTILAIQILAIQILATPSRVTRVRLVRLLGHRVQAVHPLVRAQVQVRAQVRAQVQARAQVQVQAQRVQVVVLQGQALVEAPPLVRCLVIPLLLL